MNTKGEFEALKESSILPVFRSGRLEDVSRYKLRSAVPEWPSTIVGVSWGEMGKVPCDHRRDGQRCRGD